MKPGLLCFLLLLIIYYSCKKDNNTQEPVVPPVTVDTRIKIDDADAISSHLVVWHGDNKKGNIPGNHTASSPQFNPDSNLHQFYAVPGGYVAFKPVILSGSVGGYYFKVKGASSYFKVDYSTSRGEKIAMPSQEKAGTRQLPVNSDNLRDGDADSLIVLKMPDSLDAGTFCGLYYIWDDQGNVSDSMELCITIAYKGPGAAGNGFIGTWQRYAVKSDTNRWNYFTDTVKYKDGNRYCVNGKLSNDCNSTSGCTELCPVTGYIGYETLNDYVLAANGDFELRTGYESGYLVDSLSDCNGPFVYDLETTLDTKYGVWSYDEVRNILIVIFNVNKNGREVTRFRDFKLLENDGTKILVSYTDPWNNPYLFDFRKH